MFKLCIKYFINFSCILSVLFGQFFYINFPFARISTIIIPYDNLKDLDEIPEEIKKDINYIPVKTYRDVIKYLKSTKEKELVK